ncbi:MAG: hypothetical protein PVH77_12290 [Phycisphaerales bacterium]|jgi:hypothetical protein
MFESINVENKKQNHRRPPLSPARIAGEILAGIAAGFAIALPIAYMLGTVSLRGRSITEGVLLIIFFVLSPPLVYGLGNAVGVYLIGNMGNQTGSFLVTLGWGLVAGAVSLFFIFMWLPTRITGLKEIMLLAPIFLISPIYATCGFNSSRTYKVQTFSKTQNSK